ncbi:MULTISPECIES: carboxylesterase family protein [unclassified Mucilaginibacter]|uniref:carboxylesterase/lipase family protein n=1 Tax=unclassified Mucilaginibacter TaxID=2617802 RepID=UPI002AC8F22D|nr:MULTISPECIES: carboxylesterase family protein [unclassified Mucilaginibacter]MEB0263030.1 carboxylesterase family protein [Mucilaginibacter sp. 10I4]MEB0279681.1 carboxylesterase family protein [Mucilaginibacter sp. 10B2]MEB0302467.1 carboxylesterase family protein [Mucilaginibacter sp. 5C4]WPX23759.1 carboxylesterase family protein [Mucilaginibacter sp. 5C4]
MKRILTLSLVLITYCAFSQEAFKVIQTTAGKISGTVSEDKSVHIFKGIPFATPPVGDLRWKAPQPAKPWAGVKECTQFAKSPMQAKPNEFGVYTREFLIKDEPLSEDCLYLNIWTAAKSPAEKRPVMVWIYGGGFVSGGTNVPIYDGEALAKKGIILVSIPYRVGILGFFSHPELTKESPNHASGNYGLMDQLAALNWVKQNIAAFGGDPNNVTIAGQSAGSMAVNSLVASPLAKGLFNRAIAESGANFITGPFGGSTLQQAEEAGIKTAEALGARSLADLRKLPAEELLKQFGGRPIVDGYILPQSIAATFAANKENSVPLLTGWNADDAFVGKLKNAADYRTDAQKKYGDKAAEFLKLYPGDTDEQAAKSQIAINRDQTFGTQNYTWANVQSAKGKAKVYLYRFSRRLPATEAFKKYGAFHTGEVAYVFNNLKFLNRPLEQVDYDLANTISQYWVNFVKTGNPKGYQLPAWPSYNTTTAKIMYLGETPAAKSLVDKAALEFMVKHITK